ncbi:MAG: hypothetical protein BTN85_2068 [Candidatus Methanohalarchaeum thermophilum]|uniref:Uncharacterized protein n=1 Tax=Methanohalarchaeum thermophilum TaxID=1903181 RepID=A0A1Q6DSU7_METT1|nr:MAG: hypothetical protein BTN85_2068 [Candidatus Methanohalarchaeum thermophilum]
MLKWLEHIFLVKVNRFEWLAPGLRHSLKGEKTASSGNATMLENLNFSASGKSVLARADGTTDHVRFPEVDGSRSTGPWNRF